MNYFKTDDGKVIFAATDEPFADRVKKVSDSDRNQYTSIDDAKEIWGCLDFAEFFDTIYSEFGEGTYQVNVTTHQEIKIDEEYLNQDFLVAIEGSCELKLEKENFYLTTITDVYPSVYLVNTGNYLTLNEWRDRVDGNGEITEDVRKTIHMLIDGISVSAKKDYMEKNIIHHMPVWDKISATSLES